MPTPSTHGEARDLTIKSAIEEVLHENRDWLRNLVREALEDAAHAEMEREAEIRAHLADPRTAIPVVKGQA